MSSEEGETVQLYVYDLSNGLARQLSPMLLNKQVTQTFHMNHARDTKSDV